MPRVHGGAGTERPGTGAAQRAQQETRAQGWAREHPEGPGHGSSAPGGRAGPEPTAGRTRDAPAAHRAGGRVPRSPLTFPPRPPGSALARAQKRVTAPPASPKVSRASEPPLPRATSRERRRARARGALSGAASRESPCAARWAAPCRARACERPDARAPFRGAAGAATAGASAGPGTARHGRAAPRLLPPWGCPSGAPQPRFSRLQRAPEPSGPSPTLSAASAGTGSRRWTSGARTRQHRPAAQVTAGLGPDPAAGRAAACPAERCGLGLRAGPEASPLPPPGPTLPGRPVTRPGAAAGPPAAVRLAPSCCCSARRPRGRGPAVRGRPAPAAT